MDSTAQAFLADVLARVALDGPIFVNGLPKPPIASINMGAAGIAYVLYRIACTRSDAALLALADVWAARAACSVGDDAGFYNPEVELRPETVGRISPYHTPTGIFVTQALIAQARGDRMAQEVAVHRFIAAADQSCDGLDVTLGKPACWLPVRCSARPCPIRPQRSEPVYSPLAMRRWRGYLARTSTAIRPFGRRMS